MSEELAISLRGVSKCFKRYDRPVDRLKELLIPGKSRAQEFWALRDIDLDVPKGQTLGIVGRNGSGKSTLLQIIAGTLTPTTGTVQVNGRVSALLELGSGFNPEFTGRQNVFFNGQLLGLTKGEVEERFDTIAAFADIGDFIDQPVKTYSSGMFVRLAFAVAVHVEPSILIVDEALAVGDVIFQHKCLRLMRSMMNDGITSIFVSHDASSVKNLCQMAVLLDNGRSVTSGNPNMVLSQYMKMVTEIESIDSKESFHIDQSNALKLNSKNQNQELTNSSPCVFDNDNASNILEQIESHTSQLISRGTYKARIENIVIECIDNICSKDNNFYIIRFGEKIKIGCSIRAFSELPSCIIGFFLCDRYGNYIIGTNTYEEKILIENVTPESPVSIEFIFKVFLQPGFYSLTIAGVESYLDVNFEWIDNAAFLQVLPPESGKNIWSMVYQPISVKTYF